MECLHALIAHCYSSCAHATVDAASLTLSDADRNNALGVPALFARMFFVLSVILVIGSLLFVWLATMSARLSAHLTSPVIAVAVAALSNILGLVCGGVLLKYVHQRLALLAPHRFCFSRILLLPYPLSVAFVSRG